MILIDDRVGSRELLHLFKPYDVQVELSHLEYGDLAWFGEGPSGPELVGVERKTIHDLVASMSSKRLSGHQLPGLMGAYEWVYLLVEGIWRCGDTGALEVWWGGGWKSLSFGTRSVLYRWVDHYLTTLSNICGVKVHYTSGDKQTVAWVVSQYKWWCDKEWDEHKSHVEIYAPCEESRRRHRGSFTHKSAGLVEKVASQLPGISSKSWAVGERFKTVYQMVNAGEGDWVRIKGVGKKGARTIVDAINGR